MKYVVAIPFLYALALSSAYAAPDFYKPVFDDKPSFILDGRVSIHLPTSHITELSRFADNKTWAAERVFRYSVGDQALTLTVRELMATRTDSLVSQLAKLVQTYPDPIGTQYKIAQLDRNRFIVEPSISVKHKQALIRTLFIVNGDNTVQSVDFHANAAALKDLKSVTDLTLSFLNSVKTSTRKINIQAKASVLHSIGNKIHIKLNLPKRHIMMFTEDSVSRTYFIQKLAPLGTELQRISVRIGKRDMLPNAEPVSSINSTPTHGNLFGRSIEWQKSGASNQANGLLTLKTLLKLQQNGLYDDKSGHYIQIKVQADNERNLLAINNVAATLKLDAPTSYTLAPVNIPPTIVAKQPDRQAEISQPTLALQPDPAKENLSRTPEPPQILPPVTKENLTRAPETLPQITQEDRSDNASLHNPPPENRPPPPAQESEELHSDQQTLSVPNNQNNAWTLPEYRSDRRSNYGTYQVPTYRDVDNEPSRFDRHRYRRHQHQYRAEEEDLDDGD